MLGQRLRGSLAQKRHCAGQHLVHDAADGVLVDAVVGLLTGGLLGRHVFGGSQHHADLRELLATSDLGDAKVDDLYKVALPFALEQKDVFGL